MSCPPEKTTDEESAYRAIFEASSDGLVINDADTGIVLAANPAFCRMHGYDQMVGLHPTVFIHPDSHHLFDLYVRAIEQGHEFRTRAQDLRRDGTTFDVEVVGRGFVYQGRFALLGVVRDMTEHVRAYQDLEDRVAERTREIERRREVAEALGELLSVVNSRRTLDDMLSAIMAQAARLLGSNGEALYLVDEANPALLRLQASRNIPVEAEAPTVTVGTPVIGLAAERRRPAVALDLPALVTAPPVASIDEQLVDRGSYLEVVHRGPGSANQAGRQRENRVLAEHFHSLVVVPIVARGTAHGALMLAYWELHQPADDELELIAAFAGQAGLAIESARLQEQAEQRRREADRRRQVAEGLRDLVATVNSTRTLNEVLEEVAAQAGRLLGSDASAIYVPDTRNGATNLRAFASFGLSPAYASYTIPTGVSTSGLAFQRRRPVAIYDTVAALTPNPDVRDEALLEDRGSHVQILRLPSITDHAGESGAYVARFRALLAVPLAVKEQIYGTLTLYFQEWCEFTHDQVEVAATFADQAALAIENARLHEESEQRRQELELFYQADQALHRSLRLEDVLDVFVDLVSAIGRADMVCLLLWDDQQRKFVVGGVRGLSEAMSRETFSLTDLRMPRRSPGEIVEIEDAATDPRISVRLRDASVREGVRAWISHPIRISGHLFGSFAFGFSHPHAFTNRERRLLSAMAQRAALAFQKTRLHEESERQRRELEALYEADEALHRSLRLQDVLNALVEAAVSLLHVDGAGLWGPDPRRGGQLAPLASHGLSAEYLLESTRLNGDPGVLEFWQEHDSLVIDDILGDVRIPPLQRQQLAREGYRAVLMTQIRIGADAFGSFSVGRRTPHRFSAQEQRLLSALAQRAGLAIQNAHLYEQAQQAAILEERQRLARELHDAVTQTLFSTALIAEVLPELWDLNADEARERLADLRRLTRGALAEMRTLLVELRPDALTALSLGDLLRQLGEATAGRTRLEVNVEVAGPVRRLPPEVHIALYRVAQEALNNVVKHAQAKHASLELVFAADSASLRVHDDGRGFSTDAAAPAGHFGVGIMRERAASIGARLRLVSSPGEGTLVEVTWTGTSGPGAASLSPQVEDSIQHCSSRK